LGTDARVITEEGTDVVPGSGRAGLLAVSRYIAEGYRSDDAATRAVFREIHGVRYAVPGDWALLESDGPVTLLGRGSAAVNTGGEKGGPEEAEAALRDHPAVADCAVLGVPDATWGEAVAAVVELTTGSDTTPDELAAWMRTRLATHKCPGRW